MPEPTVGICYTLFLRAVNKELTLLIILLTKRLSSIESPVDSWLKIMIKSSTAPFSAKAAFVFATIFTLVIFQCAKRF